MDRQQEHAEKLGRIRTLLEKESLDGVLLTNWANFAWLTCGADNHVVQGSEGGVAQLLVTPDASFCITDTIEAGRIADEEIGDLPIQMRSQPWYEAGPATMIAELCPGRMATDEQLGREFSRLRWSLLEPEIERYREVGRIASAALAAAARAVEPGMTEHEIAALLSREALSAGAVAQVILIAADERAFCYRHPIPKDNPLREHLMLVLGAKKYGLVVSATRMVHFGELSDELTDKHHAVCTVDACFNLETRPGAKVRHIFARAVETYERCGYPEEWKRHHQGGPTGYAGRDYKATAECPGVVKPNQAYAWNPSIAGTKSEDTMVARANGVEWLSSPLDWPLIEVEYAGERLQRADILVR